MTKGYDLNEIDPVDKRIELVTYEKPSFSKVTDTVCTIAETQPSKGWYLSLLISGAWTAVFFAILAYLFWEGIGIFGNNHYADWAFPIINFVFWIEIAHAGTLIAAILLLFRQKWRTSINRLAEAMTIFAVLVAAVFPAIHVGRPWFAYWLFPLPNQMDIWTNFKSPLEWDVFAVNTYLLVGLIFWYVAMIPDLATLRDRAKNRLAQIIYGIFAVGWRGSARHWLHYEKATLLLAGIATPTVFSTAGVVSLDFATAILPGWHSTFFPPYFLIGAIFSGFSLCLNLIIMVRSVFNFKHLITEHHINICAKFILFMSCFMAYIYIVELFTIFYSGNPYEEAWNYNRIFGPYGWAFWVMLFGNVIVPQTFWFKRCRQNMLWLFLAAILINVGMWLERYVLVVSTLSRTFLPSAWGVFSPSCWDILLLIGSFGLFFFLFTLFVRYFPIINMAEVKSVMPQAHRHQKKS
jgi:molybdopterin-containing oxidoreductase family membrane subunit